MDDTQAPKGTPVNGYKLQSLIKLQKQKAEAAYSAFVKNILQFESDQDRPSLEKLFEDYTAAEARLSALQSLRSSYNILVKVSVEGRTMPLAEAINLIGGAGRAEKLWKLASQGEGESRYRHLSPDTSRSKDTEYAKRALPLEACIEKMTQAHKRAAALREAIYIANATNVTISGADEYLKE